MDERTCLICGRVMGPRDTFCVDYPKKADGTWGVVYYCEEHGGKPATIKDWQELYDSGFYEKEEEE